MAKTALTPVEFHGASLFVTTIDNVPFVAVKPICEALGLDTDAQLKRIKRHPVLSTCTVITTVQMPGDDQTREVVTLPLDKLNGWMFGVTVSRVKPELRARLTQYQTECFDVLARHFGAAVKPPVSTTPAPLPMTDKPEAERIALAFAVSTQAASLVQRAVFDAVMATGSPPGVTRVLAGLTYKRDEETPTQPWAILAKPDERLTSLEQLAKDVENCEMLISNTQLANLASVFSNRLALRMRPAIAA